MFSVLIPTLNNLDYLKICIGSLKKNSYYNHQILVHINVDSDGTSVKLRATATSNNWSVKTIARLI